MFSSAFQYTFSVLFIYIMFVFLGSLKLHGVDFSIDSDIEYAEFPCLVVSSDVYHFNHIDHIACSSLSFCFSGDGVDEELRVDEITQ